MLRLFDGDSESDVRVTLYRDHAAWCPYCQKVWLQLEEKRISYRVIKAPLRCYGDKPASFLAKVPSGMLPVMELDGRLVTESDVIMRRIEEAFPDKSPMLPPPGSEQRALADQMLKLERQLFGRWLQWLTSGWAHEQGMEDFEDVMDATNDALTVVSAGPYFLGEEISYVDLAFTPFLERIAASVPYYKGMVVRGRDDGRWPAINAWFEAMESRDTYRRQKSDYYTHVHDLPPQLGGCAAVDAGAKYRDEVDGAGLGWDQLTAGAEAEGHSALVGVTKEALVYPSDVSGVAGGGPVAARLEAARSLLGNHANVAKFALRGAAGSGMGGVGARLCDPRANVRGASEAQAGAADAALRHATAVLLAAAAKGAGTDVADGAVGTHASPAGVAAAVRPGDAAASLPGDAAVASALYLRDRVGVPRDMSFPAARQLRAALNVVAEACCE